MERKFQKQFPTRKLLDVVSSTRLWKVQQNAAIVIQRAWRKYRLRKYPPTEKSKATQTVRTNQVAGGHGALGGMMNRMGNLLHLSSVSGHQSDQSTGSRSSKRRESIALREPNSAGVVAQQTGSSSVSTGNHKTWLFLSYHLPNKISSPLSRTTRCVSVVPSGVLVPLRWIKESPFAPLHCPVIPRCLVIKCTIYISLHTCVTNIDNKFIQLTSSLVCTTLSKKSFLICFFFCVLFETCDHFSLRPM